MQAVVVGVATAVVLALMALAVVVVQTVAEVDKQVPTKVQVEQAEVV
jgi:hypothetical protein